MCISIVASAFQYGWAPTLMPATTTLISPPRLGELDDPAQHRRDPVHVLGAAVHGDLAPAESANHSSGTPSSSARSSAAMIRRHSGSASAPSARVGSPSSVTRSMPSGWRSVKLRSRPTTIPAGLVAGGRSTGTSRPCVQVVLDERSGRLVRRRGRCGRRASSLMISAGCSSAPAPRCDHPLRPLVQRPQRLARRRADLDDHAASRRREQAQHAVALRAVGLDAAGLEGAPSRRPARRSREQGDTERTDLRRRQVDRGPDVQNDPVPLQPAARLTVGLEAADRLERLHQHPLELGQRGDVPVGVVQRRQVAHLGQREQPLVLRVLARDAVEQIDVLGRRAAGPARTPQPGELQAVRHHRVQAAQHLVLDQAAAVGPEGERCQADSAAAGPGSAAPTKIGARPAASRRRRAAGGSAPRARRSGGDVDVRE